MKKFLSLISLCFLLSFSSGYAMDIRRENVSQILKIVGADNDLPETQFVLTMNNGSTLLTRRFRRSLLNPTMVSTALFRTPSGGAINFSATESATIFDSVLAGYNLARESALESILAAKAREKKHN